MSEIASPLDHELAKVYPVLRWFHYGHLPESLADVSQGFCEMEITMAGLAPKGDPEMAAALRKLLEAKDAAVRAGV